MGSQHKETRQLQKEQLAALIEKRMALLTSQEKTDAEIAKDAPLKKLKGDLRRTNAALASIEKRAQTLEKASKQKAANAEKRSAERPKKKKNKGEDAPAADEGKKKKAKKEKKK